MTMRVSTSWRFEEGISQLQKRQRDLAELQTAMTTGKRISKPSDDPTGAARAERAFIAQQRIEADQRAVAASRASMELAEGTLGQAVDRLQDARETLVEAGNASYTPGERLAQVQQLTNIRQQLMSLANQSNGAGGYVFAGNSADTVPFIDYATGVVSAAAAGQTQASSREPMPTTVDGEAVWLSARSGNGVFVTAPGTPNSGQSWINAGVVTDPSANTASDYQIVFDNSSGSMTYSVLRDGSATSVSNVAFESGRAIEIDGMSMVISGAPANGDTFDITPSRPELSPFAALDKAIAALSDVNASGTEVAQAVNLGLRDLDAVMSQFMAARADAGATLTRLDALDNRNQNRALWAKTVQSTTEDADMVQVLSDFKNQETGYNAALQAYASVQRMSLLDYIK